MLFGCDGECALECSGSSDGDDAVEARSPLAPSAPLRCECGGGEWKNAGPLAIDAHTRTVAMVAVMGGGPSAAEADGAEAEDEAAEVAVEGAVEPAVSLTRAALLGCNCAACRQS
jgi:hypothetical protein